MAIGRWPRLIPARVWTARVLVAGVLVAGAAGCGGSAAPEPAAVGRCAARIAVFGPLSGSSANLGRNIRQGVRLALEQYNGQHQSCTVDLVEFDSQGDPKQAPALAQRLVADPRILGVVGPAFSGESLAADPLLEQGGVVTITPSATQTSLSAQGWRTFHRILGNDAAQGPAAGRYIATVLRARKVFVIDDASAYGKGLADQVVDGLGDRVVQSATVLPRQTDFQGVAAQVRSTGADAIFYGGYYDEAGALLRQIRQAGVTATFVAGDGTKDEGFLRQAGAAAADGAVITCACRPPETTSGQFAEVYLARFQQPAGTNSAESYDAATILLSGIRQGYASRAALVSYVSGYAGTGVTGAIQFTPTGELVDSAVTVWAYRVRAGAIVADQPIPKT